MLSVHVVLTKRYINVRICRDAMITCIVNTVTCLIAGVVTFSILGTIAHSTNSTIDSVVSSGPGLVFITYPEVVLRLPGAPAWAVLFFIMLAVSIQVSVFNSISNKSRADSFVWMYAKRQILGIDSEFCNVESFVTGVIDNWPEKLRKNRKMFTFISVMILFVFDISMVTKVMWCSILIHTRNRLLLVSKK